MTNTKDVLYAVVGAGDLIVDKARAFRSVTDAAGVEKVYGELVARGHNLTERIRRAAPTKQAVAQTKVARSQVKAAATSIGKAVRSDAKAARSAAGKVAKAS
ncbi:MAG: hypothetical protein ABR575_01430 [Actinomycetota bacterium]